MIGNIAAGTSTSQSLTSPPGCNRGEVREGNELEPATGWLPRSIDVNILEPKRGRGPGTITAGACRGTLIGPCLNGDRTLATLFASTGVADLLATVLLLPGTVISLLALSLGKEPDDIKLI